MDHALSVGATGIELDVHATVDGELVVCHDTSVDRTTNRSGVIADLPLGHIQDLDPAHWFIPGADVTPGREATEYPFRGRAPIDLDFRIPTLAEVLERYPGVVLNLDIKQTSPAVAAYEEPLARLLREHDRSDDVIVASFWDVATEAFRQIAPEIPTSAGTLTVANFWRALHAGSQVPSLDHVVALQVPERRGDLVIVDERFVEAAHRQGVAVHAWTINERQSMERLVDIGVDGIFTDLPTTLCRLLEEREVAWSPPATSRGTPVSQGD